MVFAGFELTAVLFALLAVKSSCCTGGLHMSPPATSPAVLFDAPDGLKIGDAVFLDASSHLLHGLPRLSPARMSAKPKLKGRDQCATCIVRSSVGITMFKKQIFNKIT